MIEVLFGGKNLTIHFCVKYDGKIIHIDHVYPTSNEKYVITRIERFARIVCKHMVEHGCRTSPTIQDGVYMGFDQGHKDLIKKSCEPLQEFVRAKFEDYLSDFLERNLPKLPSMEASSQ